MLLFELDTHRVPDKEDGEDNDELRCVNCGSRDVYWKSVCGKWLLHNDKDDRVHFC